MLDNGSTSTWCTKSLAERLGADGPRGQVSLLAIETDSNPISCYRGRLEKMDRDDLNKVELPDVLTKEEAENLYEWHFQS